MPENPGGYKAIPPVTVISTDANGVLRPSVNVGAAPITHATPSAMANPEEAARLMRDIQTTLSRTTSQQTSDPHSGRIIFKDQTMPGGGGTFVLAHRLGRKYLGWAWNRPRTAAPALFEVPDTTPSTFDPAVYIRIQSATACVVDLEIW